MVRNYNFRARNSENRIITGVIQASTLEEASKLLIKNHLTPIAVTLPRGIIDFLPFLGRIKQRDVATLTRQLATMLVAGLTLTQSLRLLVGQLSQDRLRGVLEGILADLQEGFSFSASLSKYPEVFDSIFLNVVRSGEATGKLDKVLSQLASNLEKDARIRSKLTGALIYPAFIFVAMIGVAVLMLTQVIPQLSEVFLSSGQQLPLQTQLIISLSNSLQHYWAIYLAAFLAIVVGIPYYGRTVQGQEVFSQMALRIPLVAAITEESNMGRLGRLLSILLSSGVPLLDSLRLVEQSFTNRVYKKAIQVVAVAVERGLPMSEPILKNPIFPPLLGQMISVGEQTGKMDEVMEKMAEYYEEEVDNKVSSLAVLIEPITIIILGIGVAWLVFAILLPIYQISTSIS